MNVYRLTESSGRKAQMFHPRSHEGVEFLPLRAPEQSKSLLADPLRRAACTTLGPAGAPTSLPAQPPCPLHALPPQQWVVRGMRGCRDGLGGSGVTVSAGPGQQGLPGLSGVLIVFHCDGYLGLTQACKHTCVINLLLIVIVGLVSIYHFVLQKAIVSHCSATQLLLIKRAAAYNHRPWSHSM